MLDHVHMMISIPPKYAVSQVVDLSRARVRSIWPVSMGRRSATFRAALLARGYFVSTVGRDEAVIREYIKRQEQEDNRLEQMNLWR